MSAPAPNEATGPRRLLVLLLALGFAILLTPLSMVPHLVPGQGDWKVGDTATVSVRVSPFSSSDIAKPGSALAVVRGETITSAQQRFVANRRNARVGTWLLHFALLFASALAWAWTLARETRSSMARRFLADGVATLFVTAISALLLLLTQVSLFALPVGAVAMLSASRNSRTSALTAAALLTVAVALMEPDSPSLIAILAVQTLVPAILLGRRPSLVPQIVAALAAAFLALLAYAIVYFAAWNRLPTSMASGLAGWLSAGTGPWVALATATVLAPLYLLLRGDPSARTLGRLEKLSQPVLRDLAQKAPGSWQHSLALAKLAEAAGKSIHADAQLLRVGAYYHDIGKVAQPRYFIENVSGNERSIHENVPPTDSRDGIFGHIDGGIRLGRDAGVHERVLDFVRSHHGRGHLEYFWAKSQLAADGKITDESLDEYRYPGSLPNSPETGILCICDAIEGATRSLKSPSPETLEELVHQIVFGKVRAGQLDRSGLSLRDLQTIAGTLTSALQSAHAPAPKRQAGNSQHASTAPGTARARPARRNRPSLAGLSSIRLDSHDRPSSTWKAATTEVVSAAEEDALAPTESLETLGTEDTALAVEDLDAVTTRDDEEREAATSEFEAQSDADDIGDDEKFEAPEEPAANPVVPDDPQDHVTTRGLRGQPAPPANESEPEASESAEPLPTPKPTKPKEAPLLLTALKRQGPPSPPPASRRNTIPLGKDELLIEPAPSDKDLGRPTKRADSQDGLRPGEMVIGAPPATHPERGNMEEQTALRPMPVPAQARRPEDRITEERLALIPPEAWGDARVAEDVEATEPQTRRPAADDD